MTNQDIIELDKKHVWHPFDVLYAHNILIEKARGVHLYTSDGRTIIDAVSSWWVNIHGHSNEYIANAIAQQAHSLEQVIFAGFTHEPAVKLAARLLQYLPSTMEHIFYSDNGSTAVEVAIKMAIQYWSNIGLDKKTILVLESSYHGDTFGAMSVSERSVFSKPFKNYLFDVEVLNIHSLSQAECLNQLHQILDKNELAAFIYEPLVQGAAGMKIYEAKFLDEILTLVKKHQVITIADEVMTGFGRTGKLFASNYLTNKPDLICLSKGITGGFLPLGVTAVSKPIASQFEGQDKYKRFYHGHSYTANPISCVAALASLDITIAACTIANIQMIAQSHQRFVNSMLGNPKILNIRCLGTILSIELKTSNHSGYFNHLRDYLYNFFLSKNILLRPLGNVIYILPPYVMNQAELNQIYDAILQLLEVL
jgi:adenosylmethionine-8-amino-7-oxononanoate aminotransferase